MKTFAKTIFLALPLSLVPVALAQHQTFTVTPDSSEVAFTLGASDKPVHGTFHVQSGSIDFDRAAPRISGSVVVAAGSGSSGNDSRDKKMTKDVLDASHFAEVSFAPRSYQGTVAPSGDSSIQVTGCLLYTSSRSWLRFPPDKPRTGEDIMNRPILLGYQLLIGLSDAVTGALLIIAPEFTLRLMGLHVPTDSLPFLSFIGAFVLSVGLACLYGALVIAHRGSPCKLEVVWLLTAITRGSVAITRVTPSPVSYTHLRLASRFKNAN